MRFKEVYVKQGGINLIKQYLRNGAFITAVFIFFLLGKSRTALEILRLSAQFKIKQNLKKKYNKSLELFENNYDVSLSHVISNKVWFCWLQGIESAPELVKKCYKSVKENLSDKDIILITEKNFYEYVEFPDFIINKWKTGAITNTHFSDLLRLELLIKYGGMWVDATVYCSSTRENIPDYFFNSNLFFFQNLKPGRDGKSTYISSWLISAKSNNKILMATRYLCYEYWKKNSHLNDYFLLHDFISIVLDKYEEEWKKIIPRDNSTPHILLMRLFDKYDEELWQALMSQTPFHKLSYKTNCKNNGDFTSFYDVIINS